VAFDEMANGVSLHQPLPGDAQFTAPRLWADYDVTRLQDFLQREVQMGRISRETVQQGVEFVARLYAYHPVRDYLMGLAWDKTPRLDTWLATYLGVENSAYSGKTGRMWLISLVARIRQPGCKADYMLILEGLQGTLKSQVCVALCGPWVSDQSLDIRHDARAASQHLRGKWLVEVSELAFFRQADVETLKAFISRTTERYLPRYARNEVIEPRQCCFLGTTNSETYLGDSTGGRRFWPHRVGTIDITALERDRDQIWAEAVAAHAAGEPWWPDAEFEAQAIRPEQEARYQADAWTEPLDRELERIKNAAARTAAVPKTTLLQVWQAALPDADGAPPPALKFDRSAQIRVREILQNLGWRRGKKSNGAWWWEWRP
jgi:predicted P-loop ATPase